MKTKWTGLVPLIAAALIAGFPAASQAAVVDWDGDCCELVR